MGNPRETFAHFRKLRNNNTLRDIKTVNNILISKSVGLNMPPKGVRCQVAILYLVKKVGILSKYHNMLWFTF